MGFWPFGGGKKQRATESLKHARDESLQSDPSEKMGRPEKTRTDLSSDTKGSVVQDTNDKPRRLSKPRVSSWQPEQRAQTTPLPIPHPKRQSNPAQSYSEKELYQHNPTSQSSLQPENFSVIRQPPTLYARKSDHDSSIGRRKSSKRKAEDYAREREVRAMSSSPIPVPRRPQSFYDSGPLQRETRDIPGDLNRRLNRPTSQVSLPLPEAIPPPESTTVQHSFKIGMFAALSPRPTIKYDANPKHAQGKQAQRQQLANARPPVVEEESDADKKRIDDLADDLDAGALRELMERDRRRRERKKQQDQSKLQRKLERQRERQREEEARRTRTEEYVSASASRVKGLGIGTDQPSSPLRVEAQAGPSGPRTQAEDPFADPKPVSSPVPIRNPFEDEKDMDIQDQPLDNEPAVPVRSPLRKIETNVASAGGKVAHGTLSPPTSPAPKPVDRQSMSQGSLLHRETTGDVQEAASYTGASDHSSQRLSSWTAFFRRGTRRKMSSSFQGRSTPSEFSNTSRESFTRKQQPPPAVPTRTFRRVDSATPQRTMSKFREDLPDFPISPPDSRMQSPEDSAPPAAGTYNQAVTTDQQTEEEKAQQTSSTSTKPIPTGATREEIDADADTRIPPGARPEMMLSQSLASVDSEGSWLSGKPVNRQSGASQRLQPSRSSLGRPMPGAFDGSSEPVAATDVTATEKPAEEMEESSPKDETWHAGAGKQPTIVRQASRAKSKEGLLNEYVGRRERKSSTEDSEDDDLPEPTPDEAEPEVTLMRAQSVDYKGHARHVSAGSAKLLDIRRSSTHSGDLLRQDSSASRSNRPLSQ